MTPVVSSERHSGSPSRTFCTMPKIFVEIDLVGDRLRGDLDGRNHRRAAAEQRAQRLRELHDGEAVQDAAHQRDVQLEAVPQPPARWC